MSSTVTGTGTATNTHTNTIPNNFNSNLFDNEWDNIFDGDDQDENENTGYISNYQNEYSMRDSIVFLIDCSPLMFESNENNEIPFYNAIKCLIQTITDKIITSESDLLGVCFYNTDKKKNINDFENIYVLFDLDVPDPKIILTLEDIIENESFQKTFGSNQNSQDFPFCDALWTCSTMFSNNSNSVKQSHKRIFLFTNEDNPNAFNDSIRNNSFQRAKDLFDLGIEIELFSINKSVDDKFDFSLFYQYILVFKDDEYIDPQQFDATSKFSELRSKLKRKEFKKRSLGKIPLYIGPTSVNSKLAPDQQQQPLVIATQLFNLVSSTKKSSPTLLDPKTNLPVKTMIKNLCVDTNSALLPSQIKYTYYYGGEPIIFSKDEMDQIKSMDRVGLTLLGFKPSSTLKIHQMIKHSSFIVPDETYIRGSTCAFVALLEQMLKSDKIAICRFTPRVSTSPRIVALQPQPEVCNDEKVQIRPYGFHVIQLPFSDDIRHYQLSRIHTNLESHQQIDAVDKAKALIKSMKIRYNDQIYLNPSLQKHYSNLQALALERDHVENTQDLIHVDSSLLEKSKDQIKEFKDLAFPKGYTSAESKSGTKRARDDKDLSSMDWVAMVKNGTLTKLTVPDLSAFVKNQGIKVSSKAKKVDILESITKFINSGSIKMDKLALLKPTNSSNNNNNNNDKDQDEDLDDRPKKKTTKNSGSNSQSDYVDLSDFKKKISNHNKQQNKITTTTSSNKSKKSSQKSIVDSDDDDDFLDSKRSDEDSDDDDDVPVSKNKSKNNNNNNKMQVDSDSDDDSKKPLCRYDPNCYRKKPDHIKQFRHTK
ncbi:ATP-dependent DNA helicase [Tieghemostelium lacteum]|uniref:DNA helicase n=1 Tax=Tieghemostelium lacteum TaxID=361077 RepID=A0A151Z886_TIELA|nr:ATP-dependent DNA helicase [Tieghemostelium lacteum]|eukprot:KYQ90183.1 ATP-dependent DNA helicase [Tieghemostelium lacteum]